VTDTQTKKQTSAQTTAEPATRPGRRGSSRAPAEGQAGQPGAVANDVRLAGRLTGEPVLIELPSGDALVAFRISVPRGVETGQRVDSVPCTAWAPRLRRSILTWRAGDRVVVAGGVRCRFYQAGGATRSRGEVEVTTARLTRRSPAA
jgi:single-strand DNA-binding protein